jgi:hypothetical protein
MCLQSMYSNRNKYTDMAKFDSTRETWTQLTAVSWFHDIAKQVCKHVLDVAGQNYLRLV